MLRLQIMIVVNLVISIIIPNLLHSQKGSIISFEVQPCADTSVLIQWEIAPSLETIYFDVERSYDAAGWKGIARIVAQSSQEYSYTDSDLRKGFIYYRIRQTFREGTYLYSQVKKVEINKSESLCIWPNPARNILHVKTTFTNGSIDVLSTEGMLLQKIFITNYITDVPVSHLPKGLYFLHIRHDKETFIERFIKE